MNRGSLVRATAERWTALYVRSLPAAEAERRCGEIRSDVHEDLGNGARPTAVLSRLVRGVPADLAWARGRKKEHGMQTRTVNRRGWAVPVAILLGPLAFGAAFLALNMGVGGAGALIGQLVVLLVPIAVTGGILALVITRISAGRLRHMLRVIAAVCGALFAISLVAINAGPEEGPEIFWWVFVALGIFTAVPVGIVALVTSLFVRRPQ